MEKKYEFDWSEVAIQEDVEDTVERLAWVPIGDHDHEVLVSNHPQTAGCTQWLVMGLSDSLVLIPCAEDKSSPFDHQFECFWNENGTVPFDATVEQLRADEYYE